MPLNVSERLRNVFLAIHALLVSRRRPKKKGFPAKIRSARHITAFHVMGECQSERPIYDTLPTLSFCFSFCSFLLEKSCALVELHLTRMWSEHFAICSYVGALGLLQRPSGIFATCCRNKNKSVCYTYLCFFSPSRCPFCSHFIFWHGRICSAHYPNFSGC